MKEDNERKLARDIANASKMLHEIEEKQKADPFEDFLYVQRDTLKQSIENDRAKLRQIRDTGSNS